MVTGGPLATGVVSAVVGVPGVLATGPAGLPSLCGRGIRRWPSRITTTAAGTRGTGI